MVSKTHIFDVESPELPDDEELEVEEASEEEPTAAEVETPPGGISAYTPEQIKALEQRVSGFEAAQLQLQRQNYDNTRREQERYDQAELASYYNQWKEEGYGDAQIRQSLSQVKSIQDQRASLRQTAMEMQTMYIQAQIAQQTQWEIAQELHQKHGIPIKEVMKGKSPEEMELMAIRHGQSKNKQAQMPPQQYDNNRPVSRSVPNRAKRMEKLANIPRELTDKEFKEMGAHLGFS